MSQRPEDLCPKPERVPPLVAAPLAAPIFPATVYECATPDQASELLTGATPGFVYSRHGHPNAAMLAERCAALHGAERAFITGSGMAALSVALLAEVQQGDHIVVSNQLYGRSLALFGAEAKRIGIESTSLDTCDLAAVAEAIKSNTKLVIVETITNPMLRVSDIAALAKVTHQGNARLLVDNTFATPVHCRPLDFGADLVMESLSKIMNGHSDVMLGLLCGDAAAGDRMGEVTTTWGFFASPIDCWLAARGLGTFPLRAQRASANAQVVAQLLVALDKIQAVHYPGLPDHVDHALAARQLHDGFGNVVTFTLKGGKPAAEKFIAACAGSIPFAPSLGELCTTLSHPESTSHLRMTADEQAALGIHGGTIRLSLGIESPEHIVSAIQAAL